MSELRDKKSNNNFRHLKSCTYVIVQTTVAPVIPTNTLHSRILRIRTSGYDKKSAPGINSKIREQYSATTPKSTYGQSSRKKSGSEPGTGNCRASNDGKGRSDIWLEPSSAGTNVGRVESRLQFFNSLALMSRIQGGIAGAVDGNSAEDEEECVCDEGGRRLGKAERSAEIPRENTLGDVISDGQATSDADNVLSASTPEGLSNFAADELVEVSVIHLWSIVERVARDSY